MPIIVRRRPVVMAPVRRPVAAMATGAVIGAAVASSRSKKAQQQQQQPTQTTVYVTQPATTGTPATAAPVPQCQVLVDGGEIFSGKKSVILQGLESIKQVKPTLIQHFHLQMKPEELAVEIYSETFHDYVDLDSLSQLGSQAKLRLRFNFIAEAQVVESAPVSASAPPAAAAAAAVPTSESTTKARFCSSCGNKANTAAKFCSNCGSGL